MTVFSIHQIGAHGCVPQTSMDRVFIFKRKTRKQDTLNNPPASDKMRKKKANLFHIY